MTPAMITCGPEIVHSVLSGGSRSPSRSDAHITLINRPGSVFQIANVCHENAPVPPLMRPRPSGPRPSMRNPPMTAVGMNSARSGRDQRLMSDASANTRERMTIDRPTSSALPSMRRSDRDLGRPPRGAVCPSDEKFGEQRYGAAGGSLAVAGVGAAAHQFVGQPVVVGEESAGQTAERDHARAGERRDVDHACRMETL